MRTPLKTGRIGTSVCFAKGMTFHSIKCAWPDCTYVEMKDSLGIVLGSIVTIHWCSVAGSLVCSERLTQSLTRGEKPHLLRTLFL